MSTTVRAEHVGSLLRPAELLAAQERRERGELTDEQVRELEDRAALDAIALQRDAGIEVFTDGEVRRESFMAGVVETLGGLVPIDPADAARPRWHRDGDEIEGDVPPVAIGGTLYRKAPQSLVEAEFLAAHAPGPFKITMASPSMIAPMWRPGVSDGAYPTRREAVAAVAEIYRQDVAALLGAGVAWLQLDSLAYMSNIDPEVAKDRHVTDLEGNLARTIATDNSLIRAARATNPWVTVAMHFCRGNMRSAWAARGGYEPIAERVFGEVEVDRFLLEYDDERSGGFEPLRFVPEGRTVVLGLVSSKTPVLESVDDLRRRIDDAARYVPLDRLAISPQCGFASTKRGNLLTVDDQRRKLDLVATTAHAVWD
jgi:5-methyltetrahydropteroyltriglutamate--homocysteine methyltransferase